MTTPFCVGDLVRTVDGHYFYGRVIWVTQITKRIIDIEYNIRVECKGSTTRIKRMFRQPGPAFWYRHKQLEPVTEEEYKQLVLQYELSS